MEKDVELLKEVLIHEFVGWGPVIQRYLTLRNQLVVNQCLTQVLLLLCSILGKGGCLVYGTQRNNYNRELCRMDE